MLTINDVLKNTKELSDLKLDMVFIQDAEPILFTCIDTDDNIYLGICSYANSEKIIWHISKTNCDTLISLLEDKITIYDAFKAISKNKYIITYSKYGVNCDNKAFDLLDDDYLPVKGEFMDVEDNEFNSEIVELKNRKRRLVYTAVANRYNEVVKVQIKIPMLWFNNILKTDYNPMYYSKEIESYVGIKVN